jgi:hypothetical protein
MGEEWVGQPRHQDKVYIGALAGIDGSGYLSVNTLADYITYVGRLSEFRWGHALGSIPGRRSAQSHFIKPCSLAHTTRMTKG